jgi:hypothetical protein
VPGFIRQFKVNFPVGVSDGMKAREFMQLAPFMQAFVPLMVFIDPTGMIREQHTGGERDYFSDDFVTQTMHLRASAEKLLAERPPASQSRRRVSGRK